MKVLSLSLALLLTAGAAHATKEQGSAVAPEASIPFVGSGSIRSWRADGSKGLWIQGAHRKWYYAKFLGARCPGLNFAHTLAFDTTPSGTFDRFSAIIVPDWGRCQVRSLTASEGPPRKQDKEKSGSAEQETQAQS
jgi:hypothetical protein